MILIYKISNSINNKVYVGQTIRTLKKRMKAHRSKDSNCHKLKRALHKYGKENFKIECLTICHTQEIADYWEDYFINKYDSIQNGYNIKHGGFCGKHSEKTKRQMSKDRKGQHVSPRTEWKKGEKHSEEHRRNISKAMKGNPPHSAKLTQKIADKIREEFYSLFTGHKKSKIQGYLAKKYNVDQSTINNIINNKIWKNSPTSIPAPPPKNKKPTAKITQQIADQIREEYVIGNFSREELSKKYNLKSGSISDIICNKSWRTSTSVNLGAHKSKINMQIADQIRKEYSYGNSTYKDLSKKYEISNTSISDIINNKIWIKIENK